MDLTHLSPEQINQLQTIALCLSQMPLATGAGSQPPAVQTNGTTPIPAYHSARTPTMPPTTPQGHPPAPAAIASPSVSRGHPSLNTVTVADSSSQPFLGLNSMGVSMTSQVNQQRLSAASANIPRQPRLPSRTRRRGPALHSPTLPRSPQVDDCHTTVLVNGMNVPGVCVKVKIYPPQVRGRLYSLTVNANIEL